MSNLSTNLLDDTINLITEEAGPSSDRNVTFEEDYFEDELEQSYGLRKTIDADKVKPGSMNVLSAMYESLDYDICENHLLLEEERRSNFKKVLIKDVGRWFIVLLVGVFTALIAVIINISIEVFSDIKYAFLKKSVDSYVLEDKLYVPYLYWVSCNVVVVLIGSILVAFYEPVAAGSGIPQVKCYLNGVKVPRVVRIKTLAIKTIGVITSVVGGLAGGKEGPMIHSGAVIAAGISQGKSTTFNKDFGLFKCFREDHEKRDFVSAGAAAGVSAAFGAPIGGVLFSLEEGTSFWNQGLTWRTFFGTAIATFTLNIALSAYHGHPGDLNYPGLLNLGKIDPFPFQYYELPIFVLFGAIGGWLGALWNHINYKLSVFRIRYLKRKPWLRVCEACCVAAASATAGFLMMFILGECRPLGQDPTKVPLQLYCKDGEYNVMASLWFQTPEASVRSLLHAPPGTQSIPTLAVFVVGYYLLSCWTFGLAVSSGLFIPNLLTGAAWGRLLTILLQYILPVPLEPAMYALIGAAAQLGGVVRMTISLTVIILETTGQISDALPIIITLIVAKWTGDYFNEGIYDIHIMLAGVPLLPWEPPSRSYNVYASTVMSHPAICVHSVETVANVINILHKFSHNGFPVVDTADSQQDEASQYKKLRGMILRSQLIVLLQKKLFNEYYPDIDITDSGSDISNAHIDVNLFRDAYPRYPTVDQISLTDEELKFTLDLRPFLNPSPYTLPHSASLPRLFKLFRALGLRHLPIINDNYEVVGMVTRKDIARYREWRHRGEIGFEELVMSNEL